MLADADDVVVSLTKTAKKGKAHKENLLKEIQENATGVTSAPVPVVAEVEGEVKEGNGKGKVEVKDWEWIYVFEVGDLRNSGLKEVRRLWKE